MSDQSDVVAEAKQIKDFLKLINETLPVSFKLGSKEIKAYLRALTYPEELHLRQLILEGYDHASANNYSENAAKDFTQELGLRQRIYYSLRKTEKLDSPRLFSDERQVLKLPTDILINLYSMYSKAFNLSEEELGESLGASI